MITNQAWIGAIDHRISAAILSFALLLLLNTGKKRSPFPLRAAAALAVMCLCSWLLRTLADVWLQDLRLQALCYSVQIMALHLIFVGACFFCYRASPAEAWFNGLLGMTISRIAWNGFKMVAGVMLVNHVEAPWGPYSIAGSLVSYLVYLSICLLLFFITRELLREPPYHAPVRMLVWLTAIFMLLQMMLEYFGHVYAEAYEAQFLYYLCALLYSILNFATLLMGALLDSFRHENRTMHDFISNKMRYYEMSREGITALQTTCHDLKHQIHAIRTEAGKASFQRHLDELEDAINEYSTVVECGYPTIDVVLTEKNILCCSARVKFTYIIDGSLFAFLSEREIYSLFGNALDNALEAVTKIEDPDRRIITLKGSARGNLAVLQVENTVAGELQVSEDALPRTTKTGSGHGFGLRSIKHIAEKHGGTMTLRTESGVFKLTVVMQREQG